MKHYKTILLRLAGRLLAISAGGLAWLSCTTPFAQAVGRLQEGSGQNQSSSSALQWLLPLAIVIIVIVRRVYLASQDAGKVPGISQAYGPAGGAICSKCGRAFARSYWSPNLITGKLCRCPHCGKWSVAPRASQAALAAAEAAHKTPAPGSDTHVRPEEGLRKRIEDSKYE